MAELKEPQKHSEYLSNHTDDTDAQLTKYSTAAITAQHLWLTA
jgi:hypothetical protein